jgi:DNA repair protein RadC
MSSNATAATRTRDYLYRRPDDLPDLELLAAVLGAGERGAQLASELMSTYGDINTLGRLAPEDLAGHLSPAKASAVAAALELGRRAQTIRERPQVRVSADIYAFYRPRLAHLDHEVFHVMCLDTKHKLLRDQRVVEGGLTSCSVLPREAFSPALRSAACAVAFCHNHPSGDPTPSTDDLVLTARLKQAGAVLGIKVLDHIIIGESRYVSLVDEGHFTAL